MIPTAVFCQASVDWMADQDIEHRLSFIPYHDMKTIKQHPQIDPEHQDFRCTISQY